VSAIRESLVQYASDVGSAVASADRQFRNRTAELGLTPEQRKLVCALTPGAAVRAVGKGQSVTEFLRAAGEAAHVLALCDVGRETVLQAVEEYCRLLQPGRKRASAGTHLHNALRLLIHSEFSAAAEREHDLLKALLEIESRAGDEGALSEAVLREMQLFFSAASAVWFREEAGMLSAAAAVSLTDTLPPAHSALARTLRHRTRVLDTADGLDAAVVLVPAWRGKPGTVWSVPAGPAILQFRFPGKRPIRTAEQRLAGMVAARVGPTLERLGRERLLRNISVRMLEVEELERRRIARELHDDAGQSLVVMRLQLELVEMSLPADAVDARKSVAEVREITEKTILGVRRLISDLSPAVLEQLGLGAAIRQLANRFRGGYPAAVRLHLAKLPRLDPRMELVIYRVLQECFSNISRHSQARRINVSLIPADRSLELTVEDDGVGFRVEEGLGRRNCFGLLGIRERVTLIGGRFQVQSNSAEYPSGTKVQVEFPFTGEFLNSVEV
jgi:signal transduction histidine kinase